MRYQRKRKSNKLLKIIILQIILLAAILLIVKQTPAFINEAPTDHSTTNGPTITDSVTDTSEVYRPMETVTVTPDELVSNNAILISLENQKVLFDKDSNEIIYPASLTKIMTAIVAIENLDDLDQSILLPADIFQPLYDENASMAGFLPDERVRVLDLLYGILLPSGAECCISISDYISGSEESFVRLMNEKATELGMENTHFTNSTGLHDPDHYTSVKDLSTLLQYALKNDTFRDIFTSSKHSTKPSSMHPDGITFYSTMFEKMTSPRFHGGTILGGKTGYTSKAGLCLASLAQINDREYILITTGAQGNHSTEQYNITDAFLVYESLE